MKSLLKLVLSLQPFLCTFGASLAGQTTLVKITSPSSGTVVHPGQELAVTVDATRFAFRAVWLTAWPGLASVSGPPYHFVLEVPSKLPSGTNLPSGVHPLTALGIPVAGFKGNDAAHRDCEDTIELDVERPENPEHLTGNVGILVGHSAVPQGKPREVSPMPGDVARNGDEIAFHGTELVSVLDLQEAPGDGQVQRRSARQAARFALALREDIKPRPRLPGDRIAAPCRPADARGCPWIADRWLG